MSGKLYAPAMNGDIDGIREFFEDELQGLANNSYGTNALIIAAWKGHKHIVEELLFRKADPNGQNINEAQTAMMYAARWGHTDIVLLLLSWGARVELTDSQGKTASDYAFEGYHPELAHLLSAK